MSEFSDRLEKCYTGVVHDIMRELRHKNFTLPPDIRPSRNNHVLAGQIFTLEGEVDKSISQHETLLEWTSFLSKSLKSFLKAT